MKIAVIEDEKPIREKDLYILNKDKSGISGRVRQCGEWSRRTDTSGRGNAGSDHAGYPDAGYGWTADAERSTGKRNLYKSDYSYSLLGFQLCEKAIELELKIIC